MMKGIKKEEGMNAPFYNTPLKNLMPRKNGWTAIVSQKSQDSNLAHLLRMPSLYWLHHLHSQFLWIILFNAVLHSQMSTVGARNHSEKFNVSFCHFFQSTFFLTGIESWEKIHISTSTILNRNQLFCIFWLNWFREKVTWVDLKLVVNVLAKLVVNVPPNDQITIL